MARITDALVRRVQAPAAGQAFIRDDEITGFSLRVTANGARSFCWEGRIKGRMRRITLGQYPALSVLLARKAALEAKAAVARGEDPAEQRLAVRAELTFRELCDRYLKDHSEPHKKSTRVDRHRLEHHFARWSSRRLSDIAPGDVVKEQHRIADEHGQVESNRTVKLLRSVFNLAAQWQLFAGDNPATGLKLYAEHARERFLSPDELVRVNESLLQEPDWRWRAYFPLLLMLGTRKSELMAARWADIDLDAGTLRIPDTKAGRSHLLPLPLPAIDLLRGLPSFRNGDWVFPGRTGGSGHISQPKGAWMRIRARAGVPDVTIHDLRRTVGSMMAAAGVSLLVIGKTLNHSSPSSTAIYARLNLDPVRAALENNARLMLATAK